MGLGEALHGPEQSPAHLSLARAQLPARAPLELPVPTSLPWAVLGNGQSTAPASAPSSFPPSPEQRNSSFYFWFFSYFQVMVRKGAAQRGAQ